MPRRPLSRRAKRWIKISVVCALAALYLYARYGATTTTRAIEIQIIR